jgi:hypothetical protein
MSGASTHKLVNMADPTSAQDYATKAYVDASGGGFTHSGFNDKYWFPWGYSSGNNNQAATADRIVYQPFIVPVTTTFTRIGVAVNAGAAGNARLGIYNAADGVPTSLVLDAGEINTATSGTKEITISQELSPGMYFLAQTYSSGSPTMKRGSSNASMISQVIGNDSPDNQITSYIETRSYSALPSSAGTLSESNSTSNYTGISIFVREA